MQDKTIVDMFFARDEGAIAELESKYGRMMESYAKKCLCDKRDAEEVYSDTLTDIWNRIPPEQPNRLGAFVMTVLKRRVLDRIKYVSREKRDRKAEVLFAEFVPEGAVESAEDTYMAKESGAVERFLWGQSKENRMIFVKRYYFGRDLTTIADEMGMTENAVTLRLSRVRSKLFTYLQREGVLK